MSAGPLPPKKPPRPLDAPKIGATFYKPGERYESRIGTNYVADEHGTLRRTDGPRLTKAERKAAKREARRGR